ncbi:MULTISPECIES: NAD(P)/FAD-dependent oxidoreductase [Actinosynnema]|uniref:flavin monoamine oxidase family protein n=1 Tax=Actinosynnema TaxID=40566 RepID=UPI0020A610DE|nr:NAD(P)/FAD-dependent oxidoreductase [Actinosynnema pretiosum]MCP2094461.1 Monoamine oxidase [Actinosynnema pretiosum]
MSEVGKSAGPTRRSLLRGLAATAVAAGAPALLPARASAARRTTHDVVVVGAGFAGATAARELARKGLRVLVLEARGRVGGRVWTSEFEGARIELGGNWVDPMQTTVWREIEQQGVGMLADQGAERVVFPSGNGFGFLAPEEAFGRQGELLARFAERSRELFPDPLDPLARADLLRAPDALTVLARLDEMGLSALDRKWLTGATGGLGGSSARAAYTQFLHWWALCGHDAGLYYGINTYKPSGGLGSVLSAILAQSRAEVRLRAPVASIADDGRRVTVRTRAGSEHVAGAVVVAVPVNTWRCIDFAPGLPPEKLRAADQTIGVPNAKKFVVHLGEGFGNTYVHTPEGYPVDTLVPLQRTSRGWLAAGFSGDPALDVNDPARVREAIRLVVPDAEVLAVRGQDWGADPHSRGGWAFRRPGQLTGLLRPAQRPHGRISFATSDIASGWSGYVEGAMESGLTAAAQVATRVAA